MRRRLPPDLKESEVMHGPRANRATMTGAESLLRTVSDCGVRLCFANPGTSEMHFLAALDKVPEIRPVLGLFEGAVTGMADGYARISGVPALTLLHLGPGFANGIANLHNARRARSPVVNVVGDHATYHNRWDSPLKTDVAALARPASDWLTISSSAHTVAADGARAVAAALEKPGRIATLILPADAAWGVTDGPCPPLPTAVPAAVDTDAVERVASILRTRGDSSVIIVRGAAGDIAGLDALERICARVGARPMMDLATGKVMRGVGRLAIPRVPYRAEDAVRALTGVTDLILVGAQPPVAPFAYPNYPSWCVPDGTAITYLSHEHEDEVRALEALAA
ncbi:acetolactate synthase large subunit, partial [uncultured Sphingomonas sp.]|uniref:acetolactate synthase large subunit n=1 Tax=uncultured Sphingomonas sp. TaxID=158754 RepID=UPI0035CC3BB6